MSEFFDDDEIVVSGSGRRSGSAAARTAERGRTVGGNLSIGLRSARRLGALARQGRVGIGRTEAARLRAGGVGRARAGGPGAARRSPGRPRRG